VKARGRPAFRHSERYATKIQKKGTKTKLMTGLEEKRGVRRMRGVGPEQSKETRRFFHIFKIPQK